MQFIFKTDESSLIELIERAYQAPQLSRLSNLQGFDPAEARQLTQLAEDAVKKANPNLEDFGSLPVNTAIILPPIDQLRFTSRVRRFADLYEEWYKYLQEGREKNKRRHKQLLADRLRAWEEMLDKVDENAEAHRRLPHLEEIVKSSRKRIAELAASLHAQDK